MHVNCFIQMVGAREALFFQGEFRNKVENGCQQTAMLMVSQSVLHIWEC